MKFSTVLPLAALTTAFVVPDEQVLGSLAIEDHHEQPGVIDSWLEAAEVTQDNVYSSFMKHLDEVTDATKKTWNTVQGQAKSALDAAFENAQDASSIFQDKMSQAFDDAQSWLEDNVDISGGHHGGRHGRRPHRPHHRKPNETVYQLIAGSKYTTKLAKLISEYDDLVDALNSTKANFTVFAPTDKAFENIPDHAPKPSKEQLKAILSYHVIPGFYPAGRVLSSHTAPTLLKGHHLSSDEEPQRLAFKISLRGLLVNFYSRIVAINIFGTNGVIHGVDHIILPPPSAITIVDLFPGEYSTLELGLGKTGLLEKLNTTEHAGGTLFAPSNWAFKKLGPKINAFLFSKYGEKYLKALLEYHVVPDTTLYSDAIYQAKKEDVDAMKELPRKGIFHIDLPTLLKDRSLSVDVGRYGGFIRIRINGFSSIGLQDIVAQDGVIHELNSVLIPPKKLGGLEEEDDWDRGEMTVEDLVQRLEPFMAKTDL